MNKSEAVARLTKILRYQRTLPEGEKQDVQPSIDYLCKEYSLQDLPAQIDAEFFSPIKFSHVQRLKSNQDETN